MHEETYRMMKVRAARARTMYLEQEKLMHSPPSMTTLRELAEVEGLLEESERRTSALPSRYARVNLMGHAVVVGEIELLPGRGYRVRYRDEEGGERTMDAYALHSVEWMSEAEYQAWAARRFVSSSGGGRFEVQREVHDDDCTCNECEPEEDDIPSDATAEAPAAEKHERLDDLGRTQAEYDAEIESRMRACSACGGDPCTCPKVPPEQDTSRDDYDVERDPTVAAGTFDSPPAVERIDYSKPPPGYTCAGLWWAYGEEESGHAEWTDTCLKRQAAGVVAAWAHYKARHDPPGMWVEMSEHGNWAWGTRDLGCHDWVDSFDDPEREREAARAAAWAWYDRRLEVATQLDAGAVVLVEHLDGGGRRRVPTPRTRIVDALQPMLTIGTDEDDRAMAVAEAERLFSEGRLTFEGDQPIELAAVIVWPRCLTWSDEQVAEVERWLVDSTVELPEVLRG